MVGKVAGAGESWGCLCHQICKGQEELAGLFELVPGSMWWQGKALSDRFSKTFCDNASSEESGLCQSLLQELRTRVDSADLQDFSTNEVVLVCNKLKSNKCMISLDGQAHLTKGDSF